MRSENITAKPIYPINDWDVTENALSVEFNQRNETIFALGNGYIGMRGNFEEGYSGPPGKSLEGTYLNGFYESETIKYPEVAYAFADKSQTMLNVTNGKIVKLYIEDEEFDMFQGEVLVYSRTLKLQEGILERSVIWRSPQGREVKIDIRRLVSLSEKHLAAICYEVTPINFSGA